MLQEVQWTGKSITQIALKNGRLWVAPAKDYTRSVALALRGQEARKVINTFAVPDRCLIVSTQKFHFVSAYLPQSARPSQEYDGVCDQLLEGYVQLPQKPVICGGDLNLDLTKPATCDLHRLAAFHRVQGFFGEAALPKTTEGVSQDTWGPWNCPPVRLLDYFILDASLQAKVAVQTEFIGLRKSDHVPVECRYYVPVRQTTSSPELKKGWKLSDGALRRIDHDIHSALNKSENGISIHTLTTEWKEACLRYQRANQRQWFCQEGLFQWTEEQKYLLMQAKQDIEIANTFREQQRTRNNFWTMRRAFLTLNQHDQDITRVEKGEKLVKKSAKMIKRTCVLKHGITQEELPQSRWHEEVERFLRELFQYDRETLSYRKWEVLKREINSSSSTELAMQVDEDQFMDAVEFSWRKLKVRKSAGADGLNACSVRCFHPGTYAFRTFAALAWDIYRSGRRPECWTLARTHLLPKGHEVNMMSKHRMIVLQPILNKWYRATLTQLLKDRVKGFRGMVLGGTEGIRTADFIGAIKGILEAHHEAGVPCAVLKIDLRKAFDGVSLISLTKILIKRCGSDTLAIRLLQETLDVVIQASLDGQNFVDIEPHRGIRQGGPDSMLLFNLCIDHILVLIEHSMQTNGWQICMPRTQTRILPLAWVDDWILTSRNRVKLQSTLDKVAQLLKDELDLEIAADKIEWMTTDTDAGTLTFQGQTYEALPTMVVLGSRVNIKLNEDEELAARIQKGWHAFAELRSYLMSRKLLVRHKLTIVQKYIIPVLVAGAETWALTQKQAIHFRHQLLLMVIRFMRWNPGDVDDYGMWKSQALHRAQHLLDRHGIKDALHQALTAKHKYAGHVARSGGMKTYKVRYHNIKNYILWQNRGYEWAMRAGMRNRIFQIAGPTTGTELWENHLCRHHGNDWRTQAQDRKTWEGNITFASSLVAALGQDVPDIRLSLRYTGAAHDPKRRMPKRRRTGTPLTETVETFDAEWTIGVDGGAKSNRSSAGSGISVQHAHVGKISIALPIANDMTKQRIQDTTGSYELPFDGSYETEKTNNTAELFGFLMGLWVIRWLSQDRHSKKFLLLTDSMYAYRIFTGQAQSNRHPHLAQAIRRLGRKLINEVIGFSCRWVKAHNNCYPNEEADRLATKAMTIQTASWEGSCKEIRTQHFSLGKFIEIWKRMGVG